jgi:hypothetical protein
MLSNLGSACANRYIYILYSIDNITDTLSSARSIYHTQLIQACIAECLLAG